MAIAVKIYSPAGTEYDVSTKVNYASLGDLTMRFEEDTNSFIADDLSITFRNETGYFVGGSGLWTLPLDPTLRVDESTGFGAWKIIITRGGTARFEGDLDVGSVVTDSKKTATGYAFSVETTWIGGMKRAEKDATAIKRVTTDPLSFTCVRNNRKLTFSDTIANLGLQVGDIIKVDQLTLNGNVIDQDLEIKEVGVTATLTASQARVRQACKRAYTSGSVSNPFWKTVAGNDLTVAECVALCFNALGVAGGKKVISGTGTALVVDEFNTEDKTISECLSLLAKYSGCVWWRNPDGKWYFIDRKATKSASVKNLTSPSNLICEQPIQAAQEDWYDSVIVKGRPPWFAPNSEGRQYRYGVGHAKSYEIETDFTSSLSTLQSIAEQVYASLCIQRKKCELVVKDDGTNYFLMDRVSFNSENWYIVEISESVRATEIRDKIKLTVVSETGTTPAASAWSKDNNRDEFPPYPPTLSALSSGKLSKRQSWWSDFRAVWPASEVPLIVKNEVTRETVSGDETISVQKYMLWAVRFTYDYFGDAEDCGGIDGFDIIVFKDGEDPENISNDGHFTRRVKGFRVPVSDGKATPAKAGYFYGYFYKPMVTNAPNFNVTARTFIHGKELSAYSDALSTEDYGGPDDGSGDLSAPVIQQVLRYWDGSAYNLQIIFTYGETLDATKPVHVWIDTSPDIIGDPDTGIGWSATAENILTATASGSNWIVNCPYYDGATDVTTALPAAAKIALAVYNDATSPVRQSEFTFYDWVDLANSIPSTYPTVFTFDDAGNKIDATWGFSTFTGYAYALTLHGTDIGNCVSPPAVPMNNVVTPANWEASTAYRTSEGNPSKVFTLVDSGESGHKYFTITSVTSQDIDHLVGTETETTLYATCCLILFLTDGSGNMVFGKWGKCCYYGSDHIKFPNLALDWHYNAAMGTNFIRASWIDNGTTYYMPIQYQFPGMMGWSNKLIANTFQTNGTTKYYDLANPNTGMKWRFRLATVNTYGNDLADTTHGDWVYVSLIGGGSS